MVLSKSRVGLFVVVVTVSVATGALVPPARSVVPLDASVQNVQFGTSQHSYLVTDYGDPADPDDTVVGSATWRVVRGSGNCCENYVTTGPDGTLYDFGGTYINMSADEGKTWRSVRPTTPLLSGEGTIVVAPNGDILGVGWDPYSGDHLQSFKYDVGDKKWVFSEIPVHTPFFDREWLSVIPGPVTVGALTGEYVVFLKGAWPSKEVWFYSLDGVTYLPASSKMVDGAVNGGVSSWLDVPADPAADIYQPNTNSNITPLSDGRALAAPDFPDISNAWTIFDPETFSWSRFTYPGGAKPDGRVLMDSRGRIHEVRPRADHFVYRMSANGGRSWTSTTVQLPAGQSIEEIDYRAHGALGVAAVAIHSHHAGLGTDKDLLFKLDISGQEPFLQRFYEVGRGDLNVSSGVGAEMRFDFETITILPDGRVAMSFVDSQSGASGVGPALAVELTTDIQR